MKTNIKVNCTLQINMGSAGGYNVNDNLEELKKYFTPKAMDKMNKAFETDADIKMVGTPNFIVTMSDN